jgi:chromosome segregation ATPase
LYHDAFCNGLERAVERQGEAGMAYTLSEAARATGVSKSTLSRELKSGVISGSKDTKGRYQIEAAELHRVHPPLSSAGTDGTDQKRSVKRSATAGTDAGTASETHEINLLQVKLEAVEQRLSDRDRELIHTQETVQDLRDRLDTAEQRRDEAVTKLTALIEDHRPEAAKRSLWGWLRRSG